MKDQNPLSPADPTQFVTQLEGMSQVSAMQSMQSSMQASAIMSGTTWPARSWGSSSTPTMAASTHARPWPDPDSVFHHYRRLIELRRSNPVLVYGHYQMILPDHPQIYAWLRTLEADRLLVICNFGCEPVRLNAQATFALTARNC